METITELIHHLQALLEQHASPKTKEWWEKYMRYEIPFRGVGIPEIRQQIAFWREEYGIAAWSEEDQLRIALRLFEFPIAEDKLAGILFLQNYLYDQFDWKTLLEKYEQLYLNGWIFDWNTCDWFCVRVLGPTIAQHGLPCASAITSWNRSENLWQARSSVVAFVPVSSDSRYYPLIYESCGVLIQREERFAKTAVGWILRDLSKNDSDGVRQFVDQNLGNFSNESLKNALKYFSENERREFVQRLKTT